MKNLGIVKVAEILGFNPKFSHNKNAPQARKFLQEQAVKDRTTVSDLVSMVRENSDFFLSNDNTL